MSRVCFLVPPARKRSSRCPSAAVNPFTPLLGPAHSFTRGENRCDGPSFPPFLPPACAAPPARCCVPLSLPSPLRCVAACLRPRLPLLLPSVTFEPCNEGAVTETNWTKLPRHPATQSRREGREVAFTSDRQTLRNYRDAEELKRTRPGVPLTGVHFTTENVQFSYISIYH